MNKLYLCNGMPRSGSTWLYNAVRLIAQSHCSPDEFACGWYLDPIPTLPVRVIKAHGLQHDLLRQTTMLFYSFRDIRDCLASRKRKRGITPTVHMADQLVNGWNYFAHRADFVMQYEMMLEQPERIVQSLASKLGLTVQLSEIMAGLSSLPSAAAEQVHHPVTLLHANHVTNGTPMSFHEFIPPEVLQEIELRHADWFRHQGYAIGTSE